MYLFNISFLCVLRHFHSVVGNVIVTQTGVINEVTVTVSNKVVAHRRVSKTAADRLTLNNPSSTSSRNVLPKVQQE